MLPTYSLVCDLLPDTQQWISPEELCPNSDQAYDNITRTVTARVSCYLRFVFVISVRLSAHHDMTALVDWA